MECAGKSLQWSGISKKEKWKRGSKYICVWYVSGFLKNKMIFPIFCVSEEPVNAKIKSRFDCIKALLDVQKYDFVFFHFRQF